MKYLLPLAAALAVTLLAGLVLYPLVSLVFDKFFHLYLFSKPPPGKWKDDLIINITLLCWLFLAAGAGGFTGAWLTESREDFFVFLYIVLLFALGTLLTGGRIILDFDPFLLLLVAALAGGAITGTYAALKRKQKKLSNTAASPAEPQ